MLRVRIDGHEVETTPAALAGLVLDGKVDRYSPTQRAQGRAPQPLEQVLDARHGAALAGELHRRLQRMGTLDAAAVDVPELQARVESLCQWRWTEPFLAARFYWTAAWLNELAEHTKSALEFYDTFLLLPSSEAPLRLLALNNRGVLRIRQGRLDGVADLARAALGEDGRRMTDGGGPMTASSAGAGLPTACFNLLNVINVCCGAPDLLRAVDEELTDFFGRLPEDLRTWWLGEPPVAASQCSPVGDETPAAVRRLPAGDDRLPATDYQLPILRDPTYRRLNTLVARLAAQARAAMGLEAGGARDPQRDEARWGRAPSGETEPRETRASHNLPPAAAGLRPPGSAAVSSGVFRGLSLWDCREEGEGARAPGTSNSQLPTSSYADAAGLLLRDDIPSLLTRPENPLARLEQAAQEELAVIEGCLARGQYELARARLQVQRETLAALAEHSGPAALLARVENQLERIAQWQAHEEQFKLQRTCAGLVTEVEQFCQGTDWDQAQRALEDLCGRLQRFQAQLPARTREEMTALLEGLAARGRQHVQALQRAAIEQQIGASLRHLRSWLEVGSGEFEVGSQKAQGNSPASNLKLPTANFPLLLPVPESVYQALADCRRHDPQGWIEDWAALEDRLDVHQGRYHARKALSTLETDPDSWEQVRDDLLQALVCDPASWPAVAPLFGLPGGATPGTEIPDSKSQIPNKSQPPNSKRSAPSLDLGFGAWNLEFPQVLDRAGSLLAQVFERMGAEGTKCVRLWQGVEKTLAPALAGRDPAALAQVRLLAQECLDHWPSRSETMAPGAQEKGECPLFSRADPRHPVRRFLEACERARCLVEAERLLDAQPPQCDQAEEYLSAILRAGLDTRDQLQRAATGLYLAQFHAKDAPPVQRQVLAGLEDWLQTLPGEDVAQTREREIVREMERLRESAIKEDQ